MWRSPIFEKNFFWANLGQKLPKNRVFWTLCKIASLVFSDFWHNDKGQGSLKMAEVVFPGKFLFAVKYGFSYFGEFPYDHLGKLSFSRDWLIVFFWFFAQWCKMVIPKMWRSPIFEKNIFWANLGQKLPKIGFFGLCTKLVH